MKIQFQDIVSFSRCMFSCLLRLFVIYLIMIKDTDFRKNFFACNLFPNLF